METELEEAEGESVSPPALLRRFNSSIFKRGASQGYRQRRDLTDMLCSDLSLNEVCQVQVIKSEYRLLILLYVLFLSCFRINYTYRNGCLGIDLIIYRTKDVALKANICSFLRL